MIRMKAILPKIPKAEPVMQHVNREAVKYGAFIKKDFERLTSPWRGDKPEWVLVTTISGDGIFLEVRPRDFSDQGALKFIWIDKGTKPHDIFPVNADRLRFTVPYTAGSAPGKLFTTPSSTGGEVVYADHVRHPGTKARNWSDLTAKNHQKPFTSWMTAAFRQALRSTGHSM